MVARREEGALIESSFLVFLAGIPGILYPLYIHHINLVTDVDTIKLIKGKDHTIGHTCIWYTPNNFIMVKLPEKSSFLPENSLDVYHMD